MHRSAIEKKRKRERLSITTPGHGLKIDTYRGGRVCTRALEGRRERERLSMTTTRLGLDIDTYRGRRF